MAVRTSDTVRISESSCGAPAPGRVEGVDGHAAAAELAQGFGDERVAAGPVGAQQHHVLGPERLHQFLVAQRRALVDLAGQAPGRREVDEHRPPFGARLRQRVRRPWMPCPARLPRAGSGHGPVAELRLKRTPHPGRRRRDDHCRRCRDSGPGRSGRRRWTRAARAKRQWQGSARAVRRHRRCPPAGRAPTPARRRWRTSERPSPS